MSRKAREISGTGLYHIIFRGINRQNIFEEKEDYRKLLDLFSEIKRKHDFKIHAYCLMSNHVHLLFEEKQMGDLSKIMQKLLTSYAVWYNKKYLRSGSLFGNRYKSKPVERDNYLLSLVRYIHQNPKRAELVKELGKYQWSSYNQYIGKNNSEKNITDIEFILGIISGSRGLTKDSINSFVQFHQVPELEDFEIGESRRKTKEEIRRRIIKILNGQEPHIISTLPTEERNKLLKRLKNVERFSIREIERATGISKGVISRIR